MKKNTMKKNTILKKVILASSLAALGLSSSQAATVISTGLATRISGESDISTNGTLLSSINFSGSDQIVNGVTFHSTTNSSVTTSGTINTSAFAIGPAPFNTLSVAYRGLLQGASFIADNSFVIGLNDLVVGQAYELQIFAHDARGTVAGDNGGARTTFVEIGGSSVELDLNGNPGNGGVGEFVIFEFTADAVTENVTVSAGSSASGSGIGPSGQFNALQLRVVPEPSSSLLLGLGAGLSLLHRRRR